ANINLPCCSAGSTALHLAASSRHLKVIEQLLRHGALPSARDPEKRTPLHIAVNSAAASEPSFAAERLLLNAQADVNAMDVQGRMPLHYAFVKKEKQLDASPADPVETVTSLCAVEGVRVDVPDEFGATPLLCAARRGATISSLYLSKRGASLKARDKSGNDTLGVALAGGHHQYAITLLSQGAGDVEAPMCHLQRETVQGKTKIVPGPPLSLFREATSHKQLGLSYLLLDHGYPFHGAIQDSLELGEFRLVLTLLSKINPSENAVVQRLDKNRRSLHHALAGFPRRLGPEATEIAEELKRRGVSMASADVHKRWPLHYACANAQKDLSRWLVRQDSSAASQLDEEGQCPVHAVCTRGFLQRFPDRDHLVFMDMLLPLNK
ncbi:ankrd52, partial [Symbiodinium microadriaticum]